MSPCKPNFETLVMTTMILCAYSKPVVLFHHFRFYTSTVPKSSHEFELSLTSLTVVGCMIMLTYMANFNCYCYYHFMILVSKWYSSKTRDVQIVNKLGNVKYTACIHELVILHALSALVATWTLGLSNLANDLYTWVYKGVPNLWTGLFFAV